MDSEGKNMGFDTMAGRMLERLETMVSAHRSSREPPNSKNAARLWRNRVFIPWGGWFLKNKYLSVIYCVHLERWLATVRGGGVIAFGGT